MLWENCGSFAKLNSVKITLQQQNNQEDNKYYQQIYGQKLCV